MKSIYHHECYLAKTPDSSKTTLIYQNFILALFYYILYQYNGLAPMQSLYTILYHKQSLTIHYWRQVSLQRGGFIHTEQAYFLRYRGQTSSRIASWKAITKVHGLSQYQRRYNCVAGLLSRSKLISLRFEGRNGPGMAQFCCARQKTAQL